MNPGQAVRAAVYCRISSDRDGSRLGVKRQEEDCRSLCAARGWEVAEPFCDNNKTAADPTKPRPEYDRMMRAVAAGGIDAVVVYREDRLHRQPMELEHFVRDCKAAGMWTLLSYKSGETNLADPAAVMTLRIKGDVAAYEVEVSRDRMMRANVQRAERGVSKGGGKRAFGWVRAEGVPDGTVVDETEAALIREAAKRFVAGDSLRAIRLDWTARGIPTVTGKPWTTNSVKVLLRNARNAGLRQHRPAGSDETALYPATWPAIIDRDTWDHIQVILDNPARRTNATTTPRSYPLSGFLLCDLCGARLMGKPLKKPTPDDPERRRRYYICSKDRGGCGRIMIDAQHVEDYVLPQIMNLVDDPQVRKLTAEENEATVAEVRRLTLENSEDAAKLDGWQEAWKEGLLTTVKLREWKRGVEEAADIRNARITELQGTNLLDRFDGRIADHWDDLSRDDQRTVIGALVERIRILPSERRGFNRFDSKRVRVHWRMKTFGRLLVETSDLPEDEKARRIADIEENGLGPAVMAILRMTDNLTKPLSMRRD